MSSVYLKFIIFSVIIFCIACLTDTDPLQKYVPHEWKTALPDENGLNPLLLSAASDSAQNAGFVYSLLVVRNDALVFEAYYNGYDKNSVFNIKSVSKSFISALVGLALRDGSLTSIREQTMISFFPEYDTQQLDPRIRSILLIHLLTMKAGFDYNDQEAYLFFSSPNWIEATFQLPMIHEPGTVWNYATPLTHMLSVILTRATGMTTFEFAQSHLFAPLGIENQYWVRDPQGYYFGGSEMYFTSRDLARFGSLYLHQGQINGEQMLPESWIDQTMQDYANRPSLNWGAFTGIGYGYSWWLGLLSNYDVFFALGYGGQYIVIIPDLNMIVVTTCDPTLTDYYLADSHEQWISSLISEYILSAVVNPG